MKKELSLKEIIIIASMLFGMFFGAGNLIFPIQLGSLSGQHVLLATLGFIMTGVGLPILAVAALGSSHSSGLYEMAARVSKKYGIVFTCALYLTIGPLFAIPRCATTAFTVGLPAISESKLYLFLFSFIFFSAVLLFSLKPGKIMDWIGKYLNPIFLLLFGTLIITALLHPMTSISNVIPDSTYTTGVILKGCLEGYNTMDALAGLAFGIIVVNSIKRLGVEDADRIASYTVKAGIFCAAMMTVIYLSASVIGAQSRGNFEISQNGGIALANISNYYFGNIGQVFLAATVTLACLKTAIGLITSISETFSTMFTSGKYYQRWAIGFTLFSFMISNVGLNMLIKLSLPVLDLLYPLAITLIFLNLSGKFFKQDQRVYLSVTVCTLFAGMFDLLNAFGITCLNGIAVRILPFYSSGFGWVVPAFIGLIIGILIHKLKVLS